MSGRRRPERVSGSEYKVKADLVIKSLGFDPENLPKLFNAEELAVSQWGTIKIDLRQCKQIWMVVFADGDIVRGAFSSLYKLETEEMLLIKLKNIYN